jgi:hypothetical protein
MVAAKICLGDVHASVGQDGKTEVARVDLDGADALLLAVVKGEIADAAYLLNAAYSSE